MGFGKWVPPSLLASQFAALEEPADALTLDITPAPETLASQVMEHLVRPGRKLAR